MTFALFAFDVEASGGMNDLYGRYETREIAEQSASDNRDAWDHWQLVDMSTLEIVWEKNRWELSPCNGRDHKWSRWRKIREPKASPLDIGCFMTMMASPFTTKEPTLERKCSRCGQWQDDGERVRLHILPALSPLRNLMPRLAGAMASSASIVPDLGFETFKIEQWPDPGCAK